jgi:MFS superfamily sulfate permease-like transporter
VLGRKPGTNIFRPRSKEHPEDEMFPGLLLIRLEGRVFFANAEHIAEGLRQLIQEANPKIVGLEMSAVPDLEYTALRALSEGEKRFRAHGVLLWLIGLNPGVLRIVQRSALGEVLGREAMQFNLEVAVAKYLAASATSSGSRDNVSGAV